MAQRPFIDYYEVLQLSPHATTETIERVYRLLAKRYHPDNQVTGDTEKFAFVLQSYEVLSRPDRRAVYDLEYEEALASRPKIFDQTSAQHGREEDQRIIHAILSLLYVERRRHPISGGLGAIHLERSLGVPEQDLEFPLWYMRQHGWVEVLDTGQIAISISGIDMLADRDLALRKDRLLPESTRSSRSDGRSGPQPVERLASAAG